MTKSIDGEHPKRRSWRLTIAGLVLVGAAAAVLIWAWQRSGLGSELTVDALREAIRSWGAWGVAGSMLLMVIHSFVPFPAELVAFANGMIYGPIWGVIVTWTGAMLGAYAAFGLSRLFGRPLVVRLLSQEKLCALDSWTERYGTRLIFVGRFLPFIAFNLINYAAGLTKVSWVRFGWTTAIGILPLTIVMVLFGDHAEQMTWPAWLAAAVAIAAIMLVGPLAWNALARPGGSAREKKRSQRP